MVIVLHCTDIDETRRFYESHGLTFTREQHGSGPLHYACVLGDVVIELYPAEAGRGLHPGDMIIRLAGQGRTVTRRDPDGRRVQIPGAGE